MTQVGDTARTLTTSRLDNSGEHDTTGNLHTPFSTIRSQQMDHHASGRGPPPARTFRAHGFLNPSLNVTAFQSLFDQGHDPALPSPQEQSNSRRTLAFDATPAIRTNQDFLNSRRDSRRPTDRDPGSQNGIHHPWNTSPTDGGDDLRGKSLQTNNVGNLVTSGSSQRLNVVHGAASSAWNLRGLPATASGTSTSGNSLPFNADLLNHNNQSNANDRKVNGHTYPRQFAAPALSSAQQNRNTSSTVNRGQLNGANCSNGIDIGSTLSLERSMQRLMSSGGYDVRHHPRPQHDVTRPSVSTAPLARTGSSPGHSSTHSTLGWNSTGHTAWQPHAVTGYIGNGGQQVHMSSSGSSQGVTSTPPSLSGAGIRAGPQTNFRSSTGTSYQAGIRPPDLGTETVHSAPVRGAGSADTLPNVFNPMRERNQYVSEETLRSSNGRIVSSTNRPPPRDLTVYTGSEDSFVSGASVNFSMCNTYQQSQWQGVSLGYTDSNGIPYVMEPNSGRKWSSQLLDNFRGAFKNNAKWELKDIYNHIVEFSGDQGGSRFLQDKLKSANCDEKDRVFQEILPNAVPLMKDFYGNYVLQKMFEHGNLSHKAALVDSMRGHVFELSTQAYACRVVQKALGCILVEQQASLMQEVDGKVMDCIKCENGNHVIQVAIEQVPLKHIPFVVKAIQHEIRYLSMHKYGCRIIQRLLEFAKDDAKFWLVPELHRCASILIGDQFGNYVLANIIEKGDALDRDRVIEVVRRSLVQYSKEKFASHVVEKCIRFGTDQHRRQFIEAFCAPGDLSPDQLEPLIRDNYANYVLQCLLECLQGDDYLRFCQLLDPALQRARFPWPSKQAENVASKMETYYYRQQTFRLRPTTGMT